MKQIVKPIAIIATAVASMFFQPVSATPEHGPYRTPVSASPVKDKSFSVELNEQAAHERVFVTIKNPGKKNIYVSLNAPDGTSIDNFFTGKRDEAITKIYNFSAAESGIYTIEVQYGAERITKQITLEHIAAKPVYKITIE